ncbi:MAG: NAD-dependent epimerase/dehydratase family protein [Candidatus Latescibacteria bacterium]|nr:NAD-dependent epimerase/dehydratase family protein [Candidatus Latescibacterota bacterium]
MRILVTGGAGFIGSNVVERVLRDGHEAVVVDNLSTGRRVNLFGDARWYEMDIRDPQLDGVFERERPDIVSHHAAQLDVRVSVRDPLFDADVNILGSLRLLDLCARHGVRKVIFASTGGAVYGEGYIPASEQDMPMPISPYGAAKLSVEHYLHCYYAVHGLAYVALRYANVYGPRQNAHGEAGVVAIFTRKLLAGEPVTINGDGEQTRDYVYVGDVVEANRRAMSLDVVGTFNIGTGVETSVNVLFERLGDIIGGGVQATHGPEKAGEQRRSVLDATRARQALGWVPSVELGRGLEQTVDFFRSTGDSA